MPRRSFSELYRLTDRNRSIGEMFSSIAPRYDFLNRLLSLGVDRRWRRLAVAETVPSTGGRFLDVATGTADMALEILRQKGSGASVAGADISLAMMHIGKEKCGKTGGAGRVFFVRAPGEALPFRDASFDRLTCRIAPHHFTDVRTALSEMARVTRPGGRIGIIDSTVPGDPALDAFLNGVEKVRDPSHVRSYRVEEWLEFLAEAGLLLQQAATIWKTHAFPEWVARTGIPKAVQREVESIFLTAFPLARETFRVRTDAGRVASYSDEKAIFVVKKPGGGGSPG
jgi:ubiquinone/menaquinone biosynthesis methyltransferase